MSDLTKQDEKSEDTYKNMKVRSRWSKKILTLYKILNKHKGIII